MTPTHQPSLPLNDSVIETTACDDLAALLDRLHSEGRAVFAVESTGPATWSVECQRGKTQEKTE